jgi:hypothetical protein
MFKEHGKQYNPFHLIDLICADKCFVRTRLPVCLLDCLLLWEEGRGMSAMEPKDTDKDDTNNPA